ncbi:homoserine kinase [Corticibacter populi]|uniref:Homoserine kinase n=1 Tax=Corticibacter populi TaxID=1550736 RepID=A0A3M6QPR1_9BURK|nr:homoserine kinase [Corticibacter populi]RMX05027.1 homoserine kinase [Corticibacter populi]RZS33537.1 homoserine kinase [Corticibacter populi]
MAVYTEVRAADAQLLLNQLELGSLQALKGIEGGVENTNYFVTTSRGEYVLTLFERLTAEQLPFYLQLTRHLADKGIPVPAPQPDCHGQLLFALCGKPAAVVEKLEGQSQLAPQPVHCAQLGGMLARMHLAGRDFALQQPNLRALPWWNATVPQVLPHLDAAQAQLLQQELAHQNAVAASADYARLPRGPVHADLFRDNAMFVGDRLSGIFDFYFAGVDTWMFDLGVVLNDWCIELESGRFDAARVQVLLRAYEAVRPLEAVERALLPDMLRAAALRFWVSRLWDFYLPRQASMLKPHDPGHFERVLRARLTGDLASALA